MKKVFYTELAYVIGLLTLALGTAFMERADFGMSMVVAPAYILYLKVSSYIDWFTFGMAEYCFQAFLLVVLSLVMLSFKKKFIFSFVTAVIYGLILDLMMKMLAFIPDGGMVQRVIFYLFGMVICALGVAFLFHTYLSPEAYELFVKELSEKHNWPISRVKTTYDICSCLVAVAMSFILLGQLQGVKIGTIVCALVNGWIIGRFSALLEKIFDFKDLVKIKFSKGDK